MSSKRVPPIAYSDQHNGLGDPDRPTIAEHQRRTPERIAAERADRASPSPFIRRLRRVARAALKPGKSGR